MAASPVQAELFEVDLPVNNLIYTTYQHFPYQPWDAFAELIDNATQSFFDHRSELQSPVRVSIEYDRTDDGDFIYVFDNAYGMDEVTIRRAVKLAERPPDTSGRCEFGMGMKTSCCWFGDYWSVRTKQLGHPFEYFFEMDVPQFAKSDSNKMVIRKVQKPLDEHYTKVEVRHLHREFRTRKLSQIKDRLGLAYQRDIINGDLTLLFNGAELGAALPDLLKENGKEVRRDLAFDVDGHRVTGWVGLLAQRKGSAYAGFNVYRRGRLIMPNMKFIGPGLFPTVSTNVIHQRLTGALDLDTLPAVHLKNAIDLRDLQQPFEEQLAEQIKDVRAAAISTKYAKADSDQKLEHVADVIDEVLSKEDVVEQLQIADDLRDVDLPDNTEPGDDLDKRTPYLSRTLKIRNGAQLRVFLSDKNPTELYMTYKGRTNVFGLDVEINTAHPYIADADDVSFDMFVQLAVLESLAEWLTDKGEHAPSVSRKARQLKDTLMRSAEMQFNSIQ